MLKWLAELNVTETVFLISALPFTVILVIQTLLLLFGAGGAQEADGDSGDATDLTDSDGDGIPDNAEADGDHDSGHDDVDAGLRFFTVRGFVSFFTIFGWSGLAISRSGGGAAISIISAFLLGSLSMLLTALLLKWIIKLQENGAQELENAVGLRGSVYLTVPAAGKGHGKVNILLQGRLSECDAVTDGESLPTGSEITVTGVRGELLVVSSPGTDAHGISG